MLCIVRGKKHIKKLCKAEFIIVGVVHGDKESPHINYFLKKIMV